MLSEKDHSRSLLLSTGRKRNLHDVLHVLKLAGEIVFHGKLLEQGMKVEFKSEKVEIKNKDGRTIAIAPKLNSLFQLKTRLSITKNPQRKLKSKTISNSGIVEWVISASII
jgi:DUF917 family protein